MCIKIVLWLVLLAYAMSTIAVDLEGILQENAKNNTLSMFLLGTVDGKSFFVDNIEPYRNWTEARKYCKNTGLRLASITSQVQTNFLNSKANCADESAYLCGAYWTGGIIFKIDIADFMWEHNNETVLNPGLNFDQGTNLCLSYFTGGTLQKANCTSPAKTLCELVVAD